MPIPVGPLLGKQLGGGRSKRRGADTRQAAAPSIAMTPTNGPVLRAARAGGVWTGGYAVGYAGKMSTFVLIGVRE